MAVFIIGERAGGSIEVFEGTSVESIFVHYNFLPLRCRRSQLLLGWRRIDIPRHAVSMRAGYLRTWPPILASIFLFAATQSDEVWSIGLNVLIGAAFLALWIHAFRLGRVTGDEARRRRVYRAVTGWAADPALLVYDDPELPARLRNELAARATRMAPDGYRDALADFGAVATHAGAADPSYLAIALTVARIEGDDALVANIWARLASVAHALPESVLERASPGSEANEETS